MKIHWVEEATREGAVASLEDFNVLAHMMVHKIVEDENKNTESTEEKPKKLLE